MRNEIMKNKTYIAKYLPTLRSLAETADSLRRQQPNGFFTLHSSLFTFLAFLTLHSSLFTSCSDDYTLNDAELEVTQTIAATSGKLRFIPDQTNTNTRLTYSGSTTTFDNGDAVGCIICQLNASGDTTYVATSKWVYNTTYNTFMIQRYWTTQERTTNNPSGFTGTTSTTTTTSKTRADDTETTTSTTLYAYEPTEGDLTNFFISYETTQNTLGDDDDDDDLGGGYTIISSDITDDYPLLFFFYYPYIDPFETTWVTTSTGDTLSSDTYTATTNIHCWPIDESDKYLAGFPAGAAGCSFNTTSIYTSTISNGDTTQTTRTPSYTNTKVSTSYNWRQMPYFVCMDQDATSPMALQASDMLYVRYSSAVSSSTAGNLRLSFAKMGSTLRILSTTDIVNARLVCYSSTSTESVEQDDVTYYPNSSTTPITVGQCIDLATGYLTDVPADNDTLSSQYSCQQLYSTSYALRGRNYSYTSAYPAPTISGVTITTPTSAVRLHLPPQDGFTGKLAFQYSADFSSNDSTSTTATDFSKATYYANHASEVAWHYLDLSGLGGDDGTLESGTRYTVNAFSMDDSWICFNSSGAQTTLNGAYLTVGAENSTSVSDHNSLASSVSIPYPNDTTYTYYLKMQNSAGDYLGVYVPTVMTLTMYFAKTGSIVSKTSTDSDGDTIYTYYTSPTAVLVYRTENINFSGTDYYASPTITEDSSGNYLMTSLKLTEGYYRVRRSGGDTWLLLAVLSM